jgi:hypothetical protein
MGCRQSNKHLGEKRRRRVRAHVHTPVVESGANAGAVEQRTAGPFELHCSIVEKVPSQHLVYVSWGDSATNVCDAQWSGGHG